MTARTRSGTVAVLSLVLVLSLLVVVAPRAPAQPFGPSGCCRYANNFYHEYFYYQLEDATINASNWSWTNNYDPTVINTNRTFAHDDSDVSVIDNYYSSGNIATWVCDQVSTSDSSICHHSHVNVDNSNFNGKTWTAKRHTMCQEFGHSFGLDHDTTRNTCMDDTDLSKIYLSDHDRSHLSSRY